MHTSEFVQGGLGERLEGTSDISCAGGSDDVVGQAFVSTFLLKNVLTKARLSTRRAGPTSTLGGNPGISLGVAGGGGFPPEACMGLNLFDGCSYLGKLNVGTVSDLRRCGSCNVRVSKFAGISKLGSAKMRVSNVTGIANGETYKFVLSKLAGIANASTCNLSVTNLKGVSKKSVGNINVTNLIGIDRSAEKLTVSNLTGMGGSVRTKLVVKKLVGISKGSSENMRLASLLGMDKGSGRK